MNADNKESRLVRLFLIIIIVALSASLITYFVIDNSKPKPPQSLSSKEQIALDQKISSLTNLLAISKHGTEVSVEPTNPEKYSESDDSRKISFTEKEVNIIIANEFQSEHPVVLDFDNNLVSLKTLITVENDFPILGGKDVPLTAGIEIKTINNEISIVLKGVSLWGVPLPNSLLGDMKNLDLIAEYAPEPGIAHMLKETFKEIVVSKDVIELILHE
jgi:ABC-type antimicrobial peptide transport system permease subunit